MRQSRIYTAQALAAGKAVDLDGGASHYLGRVLRLAVGDTVTLFNGDGSDYAAEIRDIGRDRMSVMVIDARALGNESPLSITLVQAISRGERMDFSLQKATELGVNCIQPLTSQRVEVRLDHDKQAKRLAHWQKVVISACEQSGRARLPEVKSPMALRQWLQDGTDAQRLVLEPSATLKLSSALSAMSPVSILVGPEGGFAPEEMEQIRLNGVKAVSLGPRTLRTETAGPAAIAVLQALLGDC